MNAILINERLKKMKSYEKLLNYQYEPRFPKKYNNWKRNIYYKDCKEDFIEDLSMFGFSPFISKGFREQIRDPLIMQFKPSRFNYGLINYVKRKYINKSSREIVLPSDRKEKGNKLKKKLFLSDALRLIDIQRNNALDYEDKLNTNESLLNNNKNNNHHHHHHRQSEDKNEPIKTAATNATEHLLSYTNIPQNHIRSKEPISHWNQKVDTTQKFPSFKGKPNKDNQIKEGRMINKQGIFTAFSRFRKSKNTILNNSSHFWNNSTHMSKLNTIKSTKCLDIINIKKRSQNRYADLGPNNLFDKANKIQRIGNNMSC